MAFLRDKALDDVSEGDLQALLTLGEDAAERKVIDYKVELPKKTDEGRLRYRADIVSFANAIGGDIVFGMDEKEGVPVELKGITGIDLDETKLFLENVARSCIVPPIRDVEVRPVVLSSGAHAFIVRIPQSYQRPHAIERDNWLRFYGRGSSGNYPLGIEAVRSAVLATNALAERLKGFRTNRVLSIVSDDTPISVSRAARLILHLVPVNAFEFETQVSFEKLWKSRNEAWPGVSYRTLDYRPNIDGVLAFAPSRPGVAEAYIQMFRSGIIEVVSTDTLWSNDDSIPILRLEEDLITMLPRWLALMKDLNVQPRVVCLIALTGVKGKSIPASNEQGRIEAFDRDIVLLPEITIDKWDVDAAELLRPTFDLIWNASGHTRSRGYDVDGNRRKP